MVLTNIVIQKSVIPAGIAGIQMPWMAYVNFAQLKIIGMFDFRHHIPVFWIPAIPAGMTCYKTCVDTYAWMMVFIFTPKNLTHKAFA